MAVRQLKRKERSLTLKFVSIRLVSDLLGKLVSSFQAIKYGELHYRHLERLKIKALKFNKCNFNKKISVN